MTYVQMHPDMSMYVQASMRSVVFSGNISPYPIEVSVMIDQ